MSSDPKLTIAGNNDLASDSARHAISSGMADPIYLWRSTEDPIVGTSPIVILADPNERAGFARAALEAGIPAVTLPPSDLDEDLKEAVIDGRIKFMSQLHGLPTLARLAVDCRARQYGRRYGVFAAHRLPRNYAGNLDNALNDLLVYVCTLIDSRLIRVSATLIETEGSSAGWFILARFADDTIATIEVGAFLPRAEDPNGDLLIEVTGSEAVLRAEPERQSVIVNGDAGYQRLPWYADPSQSLLRCAHEILDRDDSDQHVSAFELIRHVGAAASSDEAISLIP
jgi:hypothetical protein